jgi:predicted protein tyrosine phosphatase
MLIVGRHKVLDSINSDISGVISINDVGDTSPVQDVDIPKLILHFDDLWQDTAINAPTIYDCQQIVEWARNRPNNFLIVHCTAGISRSTAAAIAILFDSSRNIKSTIDYVLRLVPRASPNTLMLQHFDTLLRAKGEIVDNCVSLTNPLIYGIDYD